MKSGLSPADPTLVAAFRSALQHQGGIALLIVAFCWLVWATARTWRLTIPAAKAAGTGEAAGTAVVAGADGDAKAGGTAAARADTAKGGGTPAARADTAKGDTAKGSGTPVARIGIARLRGIRRGAPEPRGRG